MFHACLREKKMCILLLLGVLRISIRSNLYILLFSSSLFLLLFSLVVPPSNESIALKSLMIIVELSISTLNSVSLWFIYFRALLLGASVQFSSVQSLSRVQLFESPWTVARQVSLSITNSRSSLKPMSIELVMPSNHLILCCPLLLLPSIFPSIRVFSNESALCIPMKCSPPGSPVYGISQARILEWVAVLPSRGTSQPRDRTGFSHIADRRFILWATGEVWFFLWSCMDVRVGLWRKLSTEKLMLLNCGVGEDSWESLGIQGDPTSPS